MLGRERVEEMVLGCSMMEIQMRLEVSAGCECSIGDVCERQNLLRPPPLARMAMCTSMAMVGARRMESVWIICLTHFLFSVSEIRSSRMPFLHARALVQSGTHIFYYRTAVMCTSVKRNERVQQEAKQIAQFCWSRRQMSTCPYCEFSLHPVVVDGSELQTANNNNDRNQEYPGSSSSVSYRADGDINNNYNAYVTAGFRYSPAELAPVLLRVRTTEAKAYILATGRTISW